MSPHVAASSPGPLVLLAVALVIGAAAPGFARAERASWLLFRERPEHVASDDALIVAARRAAGPLELEPERSAAARLPRLARERLLPLARIEAALARAREQAAALSEGDALASLAEAARIGRELGDVEGAAAWNAEIELAIGVVAAQAGLPELAAGAFRAALTLDPSRRLLEAEAAPSVLELYDRMAREVALAPLGQLEVRALAPNARVFFDDLDMGRAPARFRATVGRHIVRVEAPGYRVYGSFVDVLEGERPAFVVELAKNAELELASSLVRSAADGDYAALARRLDEWRAARGEDKTVFVLERSHSLPRALLVRCDARACVGPIEISSGSTANRATRPAAPLSSERLTRARVWLERGDLPSAPSTDAHSALWKRWYFWGAIAVAAGIATVLAVEATSNRAQRFRVVIERGDVGQ